MLPRPKSANPGVKMGKTRWELDFSTRGDYRLLPSLLKLLPFHEEEEKEAEEEEEEEKDEEEEEEQEKTRRKTEDDEKE